METILLFAFGLIVGSFLNVLAFRYSPDGSLFAAKNWNGRSHCLFCTQQLRWYELIPVISFLIQEGRCLVCRKRLSWQYPLVELASGFAFLSALYFSHPVLSGLWVGIFLVFILIWAIDFRLSVIPDELNIILALLGLALLYFQNSSLSVWLSHLNGALAGIILIGSIIYFSRGRAMGLGDLKLIGALGIIFGWPNIIFILAAAFILGALAGSYLLLFRKKAMQDAVPFGPFLVLASTIQVFFGAYLVENYLRLLQIH